MLAYRSKEFWVDVAERAFWTGVEAGLAALIVVLTDIDWQYGIPIASFLAVVKAEIARNIGDPESAATLRK